MIRLLSAGFKRLFTNKIFWTIIAVMCALSVFVNINLYGNVKEGYAVDVANCMFVFIYAVPIGIAVLCSSYIGSEFSDGTIRNKIVIGHSRVAIYLTNLAFIFVSSVMFMLAYVLPYSVVGLILFGKSGVGISAIALNFGLSLLTLLAFSSLYSLCTMLLAKKAAAGIVCLLLFMAGFMCAMSINTRLEAPEYYQGYELMDDGSVGLGEPQLNHRYLRGTKRAVYEAANDILPSCQCIQISRYGTPHPSRIVISNLILLAAAAVVGAAAFKRRDLK